MTDNGLRGKVGGTAGVVVLTNGGRAVPDYFGIRDFEKTQHYKYRNPPWIKLHHDLLNDDEFITLSVMSRFLYLTLLSVAGQTNNRIRNDGAYLKKIMRLDEEPDLTELKRKGFLLAWRKHHARTLLASCRQSAPSEIRAQRAEFRAQNTETEKKEPKTVKSIEDARPSTTIWRGALTKEMQAEFDQLYRHYPNKKNPARAERAYFFARKKASAHEILEGLERAIASEEWARVPKDGGSIVPHPATWLNARGWENEYMKKVTEGKPLAGIDEFLRKGGV